MIMSLVKFKKEAVYKTLTEKQRDFFDLFFEGKSIFLSGVAGTGKSFCIKILNEFCQKNKISLALTASTGIAALTIKGATIHSFAGIGLADKDAMSIINDVKKYKKAVARIRNCKILFIDEISMISGELFNKLDIVFKYFRPWDQNKPFGGIQLIICGDVMQLPPVFKNYLNEEQLFFFESRAYQEANFHICYLTESKRQSDSTFVDALNKIRIGDHSGLNIINKRIDYIFPKSIIKPVKLFCINSSVDKYNKICLDSIESKSVFFYSKDSGEDRHILQLDKNCMAPKVLELKIGAQCILLSNLDIEGGFVNGTIGKIIKFENNLPVLQKDDGSTLIIDNDSWEIKEQIIDNSGHITYKSVASRRQIPLKLGYAISIHKSQSMSIDKLEIDFGRAFESGQIYVGLSRATSLESLSIKNLNPNQITINSKCLEFDNLIKNFKKIKEKKLKPEKDDTLSLI